MRRRLLAAALLAAATTVPASRADAANECRVVETTFKPADKLQIVVWVEDTAGNFVGTLYVTDAVGRRGIGNRPGRFDFNSGPMWPYGRRITTFPVWAHRHGETYPVLLFQNNEDSNLSHPFSQSSQETHFCRPLRPDEAAWDTGSCASAIFTDKGRFDTNQTSLYPPREDIARVEGIDDISVSMFDTMNPLDQVSGATPLPDVPFSVTWPIPEDLPVGNYVLWMEVAKEFDFNSTYNPTSFPEPTGIPWAEYGEPYRGQPSVVYSVPFTIGTDATTAFGMGYAGYGDPDGLDGAVNPPDSTIDTATPGSGGARLLLHTEDADTFRVRVVARPELDMADPGAPTELASVDVSQRTALFRFIAPGDDGMTGTVTGYEIRYRAVTPITEENFADSSPIATAIDPDEPGQVQDFEITGLLPETEYWVGVRAFDDCKNYGPLVTSTFRTPERATGEVDACFVATAAYGTPMANEVSFLRSFRDGILRQSVLGELFVETYYTVGPAFSTTIDHSDVLRQAARAELAPLVDLVRGLKVEE
ncbi:MAG: fibronectin type III domain-containing protein [Deltaproteobacteria bacterium]|nr:fibronectin type III domain-containing protein [Kofleriaceae bacterium]